MLSQAQIQLAKNALLTKDYYEYVVHTHNGRFKRGKLPEYVCNKVQEFIEADTGNAYDILLVDEPPQHGKSMSITETLPSWYLGNNPFHRVIQASYNQDFASMFCNRNKEKINEFGKELFGIEIGSPDTQEEFMLSNGVGGMISRGIQSGITGKGANLVIIDDPIKNALEADSPTIRQNIFNEWMFSIKSRMAVGCKIIVIMTRWHKEDLAGMIMQTETNVTQIHLPVECEDPHDPIGRSIGDALFPEIGKDNKWLASFRIAYQTKEGSRAWNALFMGKPTTEQGEIFKRDWFKFYEDTPRTMFKVISVDATFKDMEASKTKSVDSVSIQVWGKVENRFYLLYRLNEIMGFTKTVEHIARVANEYKDYNMILIEDKANGSAIIETLSRKFRGIVPIQPEGGKYARASAISPLFEARNVYVRKTDYAFVDQMCDFPYSDHDDDVDACSQALNRIRDIPANLPVEKDPYSRSIEDEMNSVMDFI